ncbi:MAG: insulinase family protein [Myxococcales bacterium]|nr:insulinase family protein [Myxococcales bacterium]
MLDGVGGAFAINASTSFDRTNYYETVPKNRLELALSLEASRMTFVTIDQERLDEQREVVRREREQRYETSPYGLANLTLWQKIFPQSNPYHGYVIGSHKDLEAATLDDVKSFYDRYYGPSNATLAIVGDFDEVEVKALVAKYFATLPKTKRASTPIIPQVKIERQEIIRVDEKLGQLPLLRMQWITPSIFKNGDADLDIASIIIGKGENALLKKALTRDKSLANQVSVYQHSMGQTSVFTIDVLLNPGVDENQVIEEIDRVIAQVTAGNIEKNDIERSRNSIMTNYYFDLQELGGGSGKTELLQTYNHYTNDPSYMQKDLARYKAVTAQTLSATVKRCLKPNQRKILIAAPENIHVAQRN